MATAQPSRTGRKLIGEAEALRELREHVTIGIPTAAVLLGVGRERAYAAADRGDLPVIRVGGERRVPSAKLLALLGLTGKPAPAVIPKLEGDAL